MDQVIAWWSQLANFQTDWSYLVSDQLENHKWNLFLEQLAQHTEALPSCGGDNVLLQVEVNCLMSEVEEMNRCKKTFKGKNVSSSFRTLTSSAKLKRASVSRS